MNLRDILQSGRGTVIDVRHPGELSGGCFPGAVNIPVDQILFKMEEIKKMQGPLVLYCQSGNRSSMAIRLLKSAGLTTEMHNGGGYSDMITFLN